MTIRTRLTIHEFREPMPRRTPVTEDWLAYRDEQERVRRAATRDVRISEFKHACKFLAVVLVILAIALSIWWAAVSFVHWLVWR